MQPAWILWRHRYHKNVQIFIYLNVFCLLPLHYIIFKKINLGFTLLYPKHFSIVYTQTVASTSDILNHILHISDKVFIYVFSHSTLPIHSPYMHTCLEFILAIEERFWLLHNSIPVESDSCCSLNCKYSNTRLNLIKKHCFV